MAHVVDSVLKAAIDQVDWKVHGAVCSTWLCSTEGVNWGRHWGGAEGTCVLAPVMSHMATHTLAYSGLNLTDQVDRKVHGAVCLILKMATG